MSPQQEKLRLVSAQLVSMSQAAKATPYSAEYLSLLARKGRLDAIKINRDWMTTPQAVFNYVKKQEIKHRRFIQEIKQAQRMAN